jgi:hypothetical protein
LPDTKTDDGLARPHDSLPRPKRAAGLQRSWAPAWRDQTERNALWPSGVIPAKVRLTVVCKSLKVLGDKACSSKGIV